MVIAQTKNSSRIKARESSKSLIPEQVEMDLGDAIHIVFEKQIKKLSIADKE
jgi:hypothetical protein